MNRNPEPEHPVLMCFICGDPLRTHPLSKHVEVLKATGGDKLREPLRGGRNVRIPPKAAP